MFPLPIFLLGGGFMEDRKYCVYKHTCPNGKVYIGITKQTPKLRWKNGEGYVSSPHFYNAIKKYSWENIAHEILFSRLSQDEACKLEVELISYYKSNDHRYGYNITTGGEKNFTYKHDDNAKLKISSSKKKPVLQIDLQTGAIINEYESVVDASLVSGVGRISIQHVCNGKTKTAGGFKWQYKYEPHEYDPSFTKAQHLKYRKKKVKQQRKRRVCANNKIVNVYDKTNKSFICTFNSVNEASIQLNIPIKRIYNVCGGYKKSANGYIFEYASK